MLTLVRRTPPPGEATYHPHTPSLAPELGRAYTAQRRHPTPEGDLKLREITIALVARLKGDGLPAERMIVALKAAIMRYGDEHHLPSLADDADGRVPGDAVYGRLFQWALDAYFDARP